MKLPKSIDHGAAAVPPDDPSRVGYNFTGWDVAYNNITSDLTVTAMYTAQDITDKFTDANFLAAVRALIGKTSGEDIYESDVSGISFLDVSRKSIRDLSGIEYFTALTELYCGGNQLTSLDVSGCAALVYLDCANNNISSPDNVTGWRETGLALDVTFIFYPQAPEPEEQEIEEREPEEREIEEREIEEREIEESEPQDFPNEGRA